MKNEIIECVADHLASGKEIVSVHPIRYPPSITVIFARDEGEERHEFKDMDQEEFMRQWRRAIAVWKQITWRKSSARRCSSHIKEIVMARKTAADRRIEEYEAQERTRKRIAAISSWDDVKFVIETAPTSRYPGSEGIGELAFFFGRLQRVVEGLPLDKPNPTPEDCIPAGATAEDLQSFLPIIARLVKDESLRRRAIEAVERAIAER